MRPEDPRLTDSGLVLSAELSHISGDNIEIDPIEEFQEWGMNSNRLQ